MTTPDEPTECPPVELAVGGKEEECRDQEGATTASPVVRVPAGPSQSPTVDEKSAPTTGTPVATILDPVPSDPAPSDRPFGSALRTPPLRIQPLRIQPLRTPPPRASSHPRKQGTSLERCLTFARWRPSGERGKISAGWAGRVSHRGKRSRKGPPGLQRPCPPSRTSAERATPRVPIGQPQTTSLLSPRPPRCTSEICLEGPNRRG